ncbi:MAG TPA: GNAT family N-acetyltransferase [Burkholderiaceae bacterium]|nr:GNAT family N-acetyltransferase [Burkholderiaceae bacterium]
MIFDPLLLDLPDQFETERLLIRAPRTGDGRVVYEAIVETLQDLRRFPSSLRWALEPPSVDRSESFCRRGAAFWLLRADLPMLLLHKTTGEFVGGCGLHRFDWAERRFEIGWWCRKRYQRQGLITEAAREVIAYAFAHLGARRVFALGDDANAASWRVCERAGMTYEGTLRGERADPDGTRRDMRMYAVTR